MSKRQVISQEYAQNAFVNQEPTQPSRFLTFLFDKKTLKLQEQQVFHNYSAKISDISGYFSQGKNIQ